MSGDDIAQLIYLSMFLAVIGGYYIVSQRENLSRSLRHAMLWGLIFLGVIAGFGLWEDVSRAISPSMAVSGDGGQIELPRKSDGHFYMTLEIGGVPVEFVVDTGATDLVLSLADAARAGIDTDALVFSGRASTANGIVRTAPVTLEDVRVGEVDEGRVRASVNQGALETSLLGMSYLERFSSIEIRGDRLYLTR